MSEIYWEDMGCQQCRNNILIGQYPREIASSDERMATLHQCEKCRTIWEKQLRITTVPTNDILKTYYPNVERND